MRRARARSPSRASRARHPRAARSGAPSVPRLAPRLAPRPATFLTAPSMCGPWHGHPGVPSLVVPGRTASRCRYTPGQPSLSTVRRRTTPLCVAARSPCGVAALGPRAREGGRAGCGPAESVRAGSGPPVRPARPAPGPDKMHAGRWTSYVATATLTARSEGFEHSGHVSRLEDPARCAAGEVGERRRTVVWVICIST